MAHRPGTLDLTQDGLRIAQEVARVRNGDPAVAWVLATVAASSAELRLAETGSNIAELAEELSDGKIQFAFARVLDELSGLNKFVLITWCGEGVPSFQKGHFSAHQNDVEHLFTGYHVKINARSEMDVELASILKKIRDSSGAKYSFHDFNKAQGQETAPAPKPVVAKPAAPKPAAYISSNTTAKPVTAPSNIVPSNIKPSYGQSAHTQQSSHIKPSYGQSTTAPSTIVPSNPKLCVNPTNSKPTSYGSVAVPARHKFETPSTASTTFADTKLSIKPELNQNVNKSGDLLSPSASRANEEKDARNAELAALTRARIDRENSEFEEEQQRRQMQRAEMLARSDESLNKPSVSLNDQAHMTPRQVSGSSSYVEGLFSSPRSSKENISVGKSPSYTSLYGTTSQSTPAPPSSTSVSANISKFSSPAVANTNITKTYASPYTAVSSSNTATKSYTSPYTAASSNKQSTLVKSSSNQQIADVISPVNRAQPDVTIYQDNQDDKRQHHLNEMQTQMKELLLPEQEPVKQELPYTTSSTSASTSRIDHLPATGDSGQAKALFEWIAESADEVTFQPGDILQVVQKVDEGWWIVRARTGQEGMCPANYLEELPSHQQDVHPTQIIQQEDPVYVNNNVHVQATTVNELTCIADYDFDATDETEISFTTGQRLLEVSKSSDEWWQGNTSRFNEIE